MLHRTKLWSDIPSLWLDKRPKFRSIFSSSCRLLASISRFVSEVASVAPGAGFEGAFWIQKSPSMIEQNRLQKIRFLWDKMLVWNLKWLETCANPVFPTPAAWVANSDSATWPRAINLIRRRLYLWPIRDYSNACNAGNNKFCGQYNNMIVAVILAAYARCFEALQR